ncbi:MAG: tRNA pseudouridine(13) synthase TruD, partial [Thermoprotei archaeon]
MQEVPELDRLLGIEVYATKSPGIGGRLRVVPEDFIVEEISRDGLRVRTSLTLKPGEEVGLKGSEEGDYTWFILEKRNLDTITAIKIIAKSLGLSYNTFSAAGLKDSRAVTAQLVSAFRVDPNSLLGFRDRYGNIKIRRCVRMP